MSLRETKCRGLVIHFLATICLSLLVCCLSTTVNGQSQPKPKVYLTVISPKVVSDVFGRRIAQRFVAIQVTIANESADYQFLIQDVSLDFRDNDVCHPFQFKDEAKRRPVPSGCPADPAGQVVPIQPPYDMSSLSLSLLRGVAEKGQGQDKRNKFLRLFRAFGTIAGGLVGVAGFGPSFAEAVAVFNGPVINAYSEAFPDYTINQMNRMNDTAYEANTLVPKQQAKVLVAFVPQSLFLTSKQQRVFWDEPMKLFEVIDLRRTNAFVVGDYITNVSNIPPIVTDVEIDATEMAKFQDDKPVVKGYVSGRFLSGATVKLLSVMPKGLSLVPDPEAPPTDTRVNFIIRSTRPVRPDTPLTFQLSNSQGSQVKGANVTYPPVLATLVSPAVPASGAKGSAVKVTLTGAGFIPEVTDVVLLSGTGVTVTSVDVKGGTTLEVMFDIVAGASSGAHNFAVNNGAGLSNALVFTVTP